MLKLLEKVATLPTIRLGMRLYLQTMVRKSELQDVSGDLCRPIVPERLWMILFCYQCVMEIYGTLWDSPGWAKIIPTR
jgi:hypothetical protein